MKQFHVVYSYETEVTRQIGNERITSTLNQELGSMIVEDEVFPNREKTTVEIHDYVTETKNLKRPNLINWKVKNIHIIFVREFTEAEYQSYMA